jgi:hypothetical protein
MSSKRTTSSTQLTSSTRPSRAPPLSPDVGCVHTSSLLVYAPSKPPSVTGTNTPSPPDSLADVSPSSPSFGFLSLANGFSFSPSALRFAPATTFSATSVSSRGSGQYELPFFMKSVCSASASSSTVGSPPSAASLGSSAVVMGLRAS